MPFEEMKIQGAWLHTPNIYPDNRGSFHEVFKLSEIEKTLGRTFSVKQVNQSTSSKGVIRGIHFTDSTEGQAKYVSCVSGALWDVIVDLRKGSPTYGTWDAVELSAENKKSVLISEGLGHAFLSLADNTIANYLCSSEFNPSADKTVNPLSPKLDIAFLSVAKNFGIEEFKLSKKDSEATKFE